MDGAVSRIRRNARLKFPLDLHPHRTRICIMYRNTYYSNVNNIFANDGF